MPRAQKNGALLNWQCLFNCAQGKEEVYLVVDRKMYQNCLVHFNRLCVPTMCHGVQRVL